MCGRNQCSAIVRQASIFGLVTRGKITLKTLVKQGFSQPFQVSADFSVENPTFASSAFTARVCLRRHSFLHITTVAFSLARTAYIGNSGVGSPLAPCSESFCYDHRLRTVARSRLSSFWFCETPSIQEGQQCSHPPGDRITAPTSVLSS
jgi:hypothetical protein